jgi:hypothetical protein
LNEIGRSVKGRAFGSPFARGLYPRASTAEVDPWKPIIDGWLEEDQRMRFKQRHTAQRVHNRLRTEYPEDYRCSYPLVQRYLKQKKSERGADRGYLELVWPPKAVGCSGLLASPIASI